MFCNNGFGIVAATGLSFCLGMIYMFASLFGTLLAAFTYVPSPMPTSSLSLTIRSCRQHSLASM